MQDTKKAEGKISLRGTISLCLGLLEICSQVIEYHLSRRGFPCFPLMVSNLMVIDSFKLIFAEYKI